VQAGGTGGGYSERQPTAGPQVGWAWVRLLAALHGWVHWTTHAGHAQAHQIGTAHSSRAADAWRLHRAAKLTFAIGACSASTHHILELAGVHVLLEARQLAVAHLQHVTDLSIKTLAGLLVDT
jgi:hypothetical protein